MSVNFQKNDPNSIAKPGPDTPPSPVEKPPQGGKRYLDKNGKLLVTQDGLELVKHFEGLYLKAYRDPVGVITLAYGRITNSDGSKVRMDQTCTVEQAEAWLLEDLYAEGAKYVRAFTVDSVENELSDAQFSALTSLCFNRGAGRLRDHVCPELNQRDFTGTIAAIRSLNYAIKNGQRTVLEGLDRRRMAEAWMFAGKDWRVFDSVAKYRAYKREHPKA